MAEEMSDWAADGSPYWRAPGDAVKPFTECRKYSVYQEGFVKRYVGKANWGGL